MQEVRDITVHRKVIMLSSIRVLSHIREVLHVPYGSFYLQCVTCWFSIIDRGVKELISICDVITLLWFRHRKTHLECLWRIIRFIVVNQSIFAWLKWNRPCVYCIDKRDCASRYDEFIAYCDMSKRRERLGPSLSDYDRGICEFWMMRQKLKEAVQMGAFSVQYNSGDVKSRVSIDAELKIDLLLTSRIEISSQTPRRITETYKWRIGGKTNRTCKRSSSRLLWSR